MQKVEDYGVSGFNRVEEEALFLFKPHSGVMLKDMPTVIAEARDLRKITNEVLAEEWVSQDGHLLVDDSDRADSLYREDRLAIIEKQFQKLVTKQ